MNIKHHQNIYVVVCDHIFDELVQPVDARDYHGSPAEINLPPAVARYVYLAGEKSPDGILTQGKAIAGQAYTCWHHGCNVKGGEQNHDHGAY